MPDRLRRSFDKVCAFFNMASCRKSQTACNSTVLSPCKGREAGEPLAGEVTGDCFGGFLCIIARQGSETNAWLLHFYEALPLFFFFFFPFFRRLVSGSGASVSCALTSSMVRMTRSLMSHSPSHITDSTFSVLMLYTRADTLASQTQQVLDNCFHAVLSVLYCTVLYCTVLSVLYCAVLNTTADTLARQAHRLQRTPER